MGVRKYGKKYRAYIVDKKGTHHQRYFDDENAAQSFILGVRGLESGNSKFKKRHGANQDLPIGLFEHKKRRISISGEFSFTSYIVGTVVVEGKPKVKSASFGRVRTKEDAIAICLNWRVKMLKSMESENKVKV